MIDGIPEKLADADGLEVELQIVCGALLRVVESAGLAIYVLRAEDRPALGGLDLVAHAGVENSPLAGEESVRRAVAVWLSQPEDSPQPYTSCGATVLPILYRRECVGALLVEHGESGMPEGGRLRDVGNLVGLAALAIANHRLRGEGRRLTSELHALQEISRAVSDGPSVDTVLEEVFEASSGILSYDTASLFVIDEAAGELRLSASRNLPSRVAERCRFRLGEGVVGWVVAQDQPAIVPDTLRDLRFKLAGGRRRESHSLLVVPLRMRGQVIAALSFARHRSDAFTARDLELAEVVAAYAAQALEHARLAKTAAEVESLRQGAELLASVSHDIRAPLSLIRVVVGLLLRQYPDAEGQQLELLNTIVRASTQLGNLVTAVLESTRLEANLQKLQHERVPIVDLVEGAFSTLSWRAGPAHRFRQEVPPSLAAWGDAAQLQRVVGNLVDNAIKYSPNGGEVFVRATSEGDEVVISVSDQGVGIAEDQLGLVFDRFQRATRNLADSESFGLGLHICRRIVAGHGGNIGVVSTLGQGSTFTIRLPATPRSGAASDPA